MKLLVLIKALAYGSVIVNGFILDEKETSILSTVTVGATTTVTPDECKFDVFENCTERLFSIFNGTNFNKETLYDLYCGTNASDYIQCLKDKINPNCGPGTDVASFKESLSHLPFNYSTDDVCRYFQENKDLIECQILFPKLKGYRDCITGETLNKTFDSPKDTCTFLGETIGCSYKYTRILCPSAMNAFVNSIKSHSPAGCTIDFKNTVEARSCDAEMLEACRIAFELPSYDNISATVEFQCSGKSQEYSSCLHEVFAMCRDKNGFDSTQLNASLELLKNQTSLTCSKESTDLMKCTAMFPKIRGYRDCITGITLNKIVDPTDVCRYFETTVGCSEKYTDLMCPQNLNTLLNMSSGPQSCIQNTGGIQEEKSCDFNMLEACQVAYDLPSSNGSDTGESLYNFICSGRLHQFLTCAQKVNAMCSSQGVDVSAIVNSVQFYQIQSALTCSDKSGFIGYTNCAQRYLRSDDFVKCVSAANSSDACGTIIPVYNCNLNAILKECPTTEAYYKKYIYDSLKDCDATYIIDFPLHAVSSSDLPRLPIWELVSVSFLYIAIFKLV